MRVFVVATSNVSDGPPNIHDNEIHLCTLSFAARPIRPTAQRAPHSSTNSGRTSASARRRNISEPTIKGYAHRSIMFVSRLSLLSREKKLDFLELIGAKRRVYSIFGLGEVEHLRRIRWLCTISEIRPFHIFNDGPTMAYGRLVLV